MDPLPIDLIDRYLNLLGIRRQMPSIHALSELIEAHLYMIPFENISKLNYKLRQNDSGIQNLKSFLDGIEHSHFGGTCYSNNFYFSLLLGNLGYQIMLCGADMSNPDVHIVSVVTIDSREYLVDVGYAAPFWMPIPLDLDSDVIIQLGSDRYRLKPKNSAGCSKMELYRNGELKHGYLVKPFPRRIDEFEHVIVNSFREEATFMNALLLAKFSPKHSCVIHNFAAIEYQGMEPFVRKLRNEDELIQTIFEWFGVPEVVSRKAINQLGQFQDAWN